MYPSINYFWLAAALLVQPSAAATAEYDLVVYGGTSAGIVAAVQAARMGKTVAIVAPEKHLGGLTSGGLGNTDTGSPGVIGGLSLEFYQRVWKHYQQAAAWRSQTIDAYVGRHERRPIDDERKAMWKFEPHVAERIYEDFVREAKIPVFRNEWLDRAKEGVRKDGARLVSFRTLSGRTYAGRMFIDASYEGDLMAAAGVKYHVGREAASAYGEEWNGVRAKVRHHKHHFGMVPKPISAYRVPGDPNSGVLARISTKPPGIEGEGDHRIQAYCFRLCLTDDPENRIPFSPPKGYDSAQYELLLRIFEAGWRDVLGLSSPIPNRKSDTNNRGPMSTDNIGYNYDYPEASYERRREIIAEHEQYQRGLFYFIANDPRVPADIRDVVKRWGYAKDEFTDNGNWPHQIYVREARRMIGQFVMTENELLRRRPTPDSVGMGSYHIDSHNVQRYVDADGLVQNEGDIGVHLPGPYPIAFGSLVPRRGQCDNLLVPVCASTSHIAYGSIRMEPVFMVLGQSAATAAMLALDARVAVQDLPYEVLRRRLLADGQVLSLAEPAKAP